MSDLKGRTIASTYPSLLHTSTNAAIPATTVSLIEDGSGNDTALSLGRAGNGATITGNLSVLGTNNRIIGTNLNMIAAVNVALSGTTSLTLSSPTNNITGTNNIITGNTTINGGTNSINGGTTTLNSATNNIAGTTLNITSGTTNITSPTLTFNPTTLNLGGAATSDINITSSNDLDVTAVDMNIGGAGTTNFDVVAKDINIGLVNASGTPNSIQIGNGAMNSLDIASIDMNIGTTNETTRIDIHGKDIVIGTSVDTDSVVTVDAPSFSVTSVTANLGSTGANSSTINLKGATTNLNATNTIVTGNAATIHSGTIIIGNVGSGTTTMEGATLTVNSGTTNINSTNINLGNNSGDIITIAGSTCNINSGSINIGQNDSSDIVTIDGATTNLNANNTNVAGANFTVTTTTGATITGVTATLNGTTTTNVGGTGAGSTMDFRGDIIKFTGAPSVGSGSQGKILALTDNVGTAAFVDIDDLKSVGTLTFIKTTYVGHSYSAGNGHLFEWTLTDGNPNRIVTVDLGSGWTDAKGGVFFLQCGEMDNSNLEFITSVQAGGGTSLTEFEKKVFYAFKTFVQANPDEAHRAGGQFMTPVIVDANGNGSFYIRNVGGLSTDDVTFRIYLIARQY